MSRTAVVLFNLGGPDSPEAVQPFLKNLFSDPAILRVPGPIRWFLARLISTRRAPVAREIYAHIGGRSPIQEETVAQAEALEAALGGSDGNEHRVFIAQRYWHPMADVTARDVKAWLPDRIVLLPLYPQFSTSTTESSIADWQRAAGRAGLAVETSTVCCYPAASGFTGTIAAMVGKALDARAEGPVRVLFSAHGIPKKFVDQGDPYQAQVEMTVDAVLKTLNRPDIDSVVCYQSKVGPLEWLKPYTEDEIARAGADETGLIVVPVAFVSEHSETLVELDIEYRHLAEEKGVPFYDRVPTVSAAGGFIEGLAEMVRQSGGGPATTASNTCNRLCPATAGACPMSTGQG